MARLNTPNSSGGLPRSRHREHDVLRGLVKGRANKQIAFDFGISPRTVEIYRATVMNKMGANSPSELIRIALISETCCPGRRVRFYSRILWPG